MINHKIEDNRILHGASLLAKCFRSRTIEGVNGLMLTRCMLRRGCVGSSLHVETHVKTKRGMSTWLNQ